MSLPGKVMKMAEEAWHDLCQPWVCFRSSGSNDQICEFGVILGLLQLVGLSLGSSCRDSRIYKWHELSHVEFGLPVRAAG